MHVKLVIVGGKANKSRVSVELPTVIGRSREADLTIAHPMISRKHCELYEVKGLAMIRDLGSLNGLFVGGTQVSEAPLYPNAEFSVGPLTFRIEYAYADQMATMHDATTVNERNEPPEPASPSEPRQAKATWRLPSEADRGGPDLGAIRPAEPPPPPGRVDEPPPPADAADELPGSPGPTTAQPDEQMPDFSAWDAPGEPERAADEQVRVVPSPPPGLLSPPPDAKPPSSPTVRGKPPEPTPPPSSPPGAPIQQTAAFEPEELAGTGEEPTGDEPKSPPDQPSAPPADEGSSGSATDHEVDADEDEGEGMFDLSAPPAPQRDESDSTGPSEELDDFLKGLE